MNRNCWFFCSSLGWNVSPHDLPLNFPRRVQGRRQIFWCISSKRRQGGNLRILYFFYVPAWDKLCVFSVGQDRETLINPLPIVRFLSVARTGGVIISNKTKEYLNTCSFSGLFPSHWHEHITSVYRYHFQCLYIHVLHFQIHPEILSTVLSPSRKESYTVRHLYIVNTVIWMC